VTNTKPRPAMPARGMTEAGAVSRSALLSIEPRNLESLSLGFGVSVNAESALLGLHPQGFYTLSSFSIYPYEEILYQNLMKIDDNSISFYRYIEIPSSIF
jgi:hypothetical protein